MWNLKNLSIIEFHELIGPRPPLCSVLSSVEYFSHRLVNLRLSMSSLLTCRAEYTAKYDLLDDEFMLKGKLYHRKDLEVRYCFPHSLSDRYITEALPLTYGAFHHFD